MRCQGSLKAQQSQARMDSGSTLLESCFYLSRYVILTSGMLNLYQINQLQGLNAFKAEPAIMFGFMVTNARALRAGEIQASMMDQLLALTENIQNVAESLAASWEPTENVRVGLLSFDFIPLHLLHLSLPSMQSAD